MCIIMMRRRFPRFALAVNETRLGGGRGQDCAEKRAFFLLSAPLFGYRVLSYSGKHFFGLIVVSWTKYLITAVQHCENSNCNLNFYLATTNSHSECPSFFSTYRSLKDTVSAHWEKYFQSRVALNKYRKWNLNLIKFCADFGTVCVESSNKK